MLKIYHVATNGASDPWDVVAEKIWDLAHDIGHSKDAATVQQGADEIMHLAADLKLSAERSVASGARRQPRTTEGT